MTYYVTTIVVTGIYYRGEKTITHWLIIPQNLEKNKASYDANGQGTGLTTEVSEGFIKGIEWREW